MSSSKLVAALMLVVMALAACQAGPTPTPTLAPAQKTVLTPGATVDNTVPLTREEVPRIPPDELRDLLSSARKIVVIDTRSYSDYLAGHIRGAISLPASEIQSRYQELPRATQLVLYCA